MSAFLFFRLQMVSIKNKPMEFFQKKTYFAC